MQTDRRTYAAVGAAGVMGLALGILLAGGASKAAMPPEEPFDPLAVAQPSTPPPPAVPELGVHKVERVISGDTVVLEGVGPVRLLGVDVKTGPNGSPVNPDLARAMLEQIVVDKPLLASCDAQTAETEFKSDDGLQLVYLTKDDGVLVNTELVAHGGAVADIQRTYEHRNELIMAERDARWQNRGLWDAAAGQQARTLAPLAPSPNGPSVTMPALRPSAPGPALAPAPTASAPAAATVPKGGVLVTSDGRFHRQGCPKSKGGIPMTMEEAHSRHYLACPVCNVSSKVKA